MNERNTSLRLSNSKPARPIPRDIAESLGKLPPQALDLEEGVLGALMLERDAFDGVVNLTPSHFYSEQHQEIFQAIVNLKSKNEGVDMRTVVVELREMGKLELVGGAYYVAELTSKVSSAANIEYHSRIIIEMAIKRELIQIASVVHHDAYEDTTDVFELLDKTERLIFQLTDFNESGKAESLSDISKRQIPELLERMRNEGLTGIPTGFKRLNQVLGGWQVSDLIIIGARPSMGKTAFMNCSAVGAARHKIPVAIFSLEMTKKQLYNRFVGLENEIEVSKIMSAKISELEMSNIVADLTQLHELPIFIDDTPALSILELRAKSRRLKSKHGVQLIMVDYLQLMKGDGNNREQEIASISRALKGIAKELEVSVIAFSQLSREVEKRTDKRPQLSDLRESGSVEQDADIVGFLYRPEYYKKDTLVLSNGQEISSKGVAECSIAKNRNGALEDIPLKFIGRYTKFTDYESTPKPEKPVNPNQNIEPKKADDDEAPF